jgi:hypothetical protein
MTLIVSVTTTHIVTNSVKQLHSTSKGELCGDTWQENTDGILNSETLGSTWQGDACGDTWQEDTVAQHTEQGNTLGCTWQGDACGDTWQEDTVAQHTEQGNKEGTRGTIWQQEHDLYNEKKGGQRMTTPWTGRKEQDCE